MSTKPRAHANKWTVVVGLDRPTVRRFSGQAKAETELNFHVQHGRQAYLPPPLAVWGGKTTAADETMAHVRDQLRALHAAVGLLVAEKDPQEICQSMVDMRGILDDLVQAMLAAGLAKDDETDAQD